MTDDNNQRRINWGDVPSWVAIALTIFGTGAGGWILSDKQNQEEIQELTESVAPLEQEKQKLEQEKQKLDSEIKTLNSKITQAKTDKEKLTDELEKAKEELAKPIQVDISDLQRPYEFTLNIKLQPRKAKNVEMTLDKLLIKKGLGMTFVFTIWNKNLKGYVSSQPYEYSTLTDDLGNEYSLIDTVGPRYINGGIKAKHELTFQLPKADANRLNAKINSNSGIFDLPPFSINLPEEVQSELRDN